MWISAEKRRMARLRMPQQQRQVVLLQRLLQKSVSVKRSVAAVAAAAVDAISLRSRYRNDAVVVAVENRSIYRKGRQ